LFEKYEIIYFNIIMQFRHFSNTIEITFQNNFYLKNYLNNIFFIFLKLFLISAYQNDLKISKKILI